MSDLRDNLDRARDVYRGAHYPGDLADAVLGARRPPARRWRIAWVLPPAIAALVAVALWSHRPSKPTGPAQITQVPTTTDQPEGSARPTLRDVQRIQYAVYVSQVRSGVADVMTQLNTGVDSALEAPLVTDSVKTVQHVAGELQEFATITWSQIKPRPAPGS